MQKTKDVDKIMFTEREFNLITNCVNYHECNPAGLPGHNLMIIISKLVYLLNINNIKIEVLDD